MKRVYQVFGAAILAFYIYAEWTGWELSAGEARGVVPASARNSGGFRSYHLWNGGK